MALLNGQKEEVVLKNGKLNIALQACHAAIASNTADDIDKINQLVFILDAKQILSETKIQIKPVFSTESILQKVQLIVKWGGEITHAGLFQSKDFAENLRNDLQLINSDILQTVKVYTSSERRVISTAEIFLTVFHSHFLESIKIPLTISKEMLDDSFAAKAQMDRVKQDLYKLLSESSQDNEQASTDSSLLTQLYLSKEGSSQSLNSAVMARSKANPSILVDEIILIMRLIRPFMIENYAKAMEFFDKPDWCCPENPAMFKVKFITTIFNGRNVGKNYFETIAISIAQNSKLQK